MPREIATETERAMRSHARVTEDTAIDWFVRLRADGIDSCERTRFRAWLAADATHRLAFGRIARLWQQLGHVASRDASA